MNQPRKPVRTVHWRGSLRWGAGVALLALAPKCLLCAAAYLGLGTLLGLAGPELCGASAGAAPGWVSSAVAVLMVVGVLFVAWLRRRLRGAGTPLTADPAASHSPAQSAADAIPSR